MIKEKIKQSNENLFWKARPIRNVPVRNTSMRNIPTKNIVKQTKIKSSSLFDFSRISKPSKKIIFDNINGSYKSSNSFNINPVMPKANTNFYNNINGIKEILKINPPKQFVSSNQKQVHPINMNTNVPKKDMNWFQAQTKFPKLNPFNDADKDGVINSLDCKPFNRKEKDAKSKAYFKKFKKNLKKITPEQKQKVIDMSKEFRSIVPELKAPVLEFNIEKNNIEKITPESKSKDIDVYVSDEQGRVQILETPTQTPTQKQQEVDKVITNAIKTDTLPQLKNTFDIRNVIVKGVKEEVRDIFKTQKPQTIKVIMPQMGEKRKRITEIQAEERTKRQQERTKREKIKQRAILEAAKIKKDIATIKAITRPTYKRTYTKRFTDIDTSTEDIANLPSPPSIIEKIKTGPNARERLDMRLTEIDKESKMKPIRTQMLGMMTEQISKPKRIVAYAEYKPKSAIQRIKEKIFKEPPTVKVTEKIINKEGMIKGKGYKWDMTTKTDYPSLPKKEKREPIKEDAQKLINELIERDKKIAEEKMISEVKQTVKEIQAMKKESREERKSRRALKKESKEYEEEEKRRSIEEAKQDRAEKLQFEKEAEEEREIEAQEKKAEKGEKEKYEKETQTGSYSEAQKLIDEA